MTAFTSHSGLRTLEIKRILYHIALCYKTLSERSMKPSLQMVLQQNNMSGSPGDVGEVHMT